MDASNSAQVHHQGVEPLGINDHQYNTSRTPSTPHDPNTPPYPWNLKRFYNMRGEDPWVPIVSTSDPHTGQQMQGVVANYNPNTPAFQHFRSRGLPSECDTCPEDSGYGGSRAPYSIENNSVYEGDSNPEAHNTAALMESFHLCPPPLSTAQLAPWSPTQPPPSISNAPSIGENKHYCPKCKTWLRTKSELNKHDLRHNKPFRCEVRGCNRKKGFGTKNDLDRHKRSVHADLTVSGPRYVCPLDQCASREPLKIWPRADNFRSHLRRIHQRILAADADLEEYIYHDGQIPTQISGHAVSAPVPSQPALREDLQGVGGMSYTITGSSANIQRPVDNSFSQSYLSNQSMDTDSGHGIPDIREDFETLLQHATSSGNVQPSLDTSSSCQTFAQSNGSNQGSLQSGQPLNGQVMPFPDARFRYSNGNQDDVRGGSDISVSNDGDTEPIEAIVESPEDDGDCDRPSRTNVARLAGQPEATAVITGPQETDPNSDVPSVLDILRLSRSEANHDKVLECLKKLPRKLLSRALNDGTDDGKSSGSSLESTSQKNPHPCTECSKTFNRQCELKKHLKRHEKPYGCTFRNCSKSFGSKNDWKRHESSQHWQLETWKCAEMKPDQSGPCGKVCQRRESFKHHLSKEHAITDGKHVEEKFEKCRIGRHCDTRFWCGFCENIIEIEEEGVNAWTKRCDHIDDHFCGRHGPKKNICKWKHLVHDDEQVEKGRAGSSTTVSSKQSSLSPNSSTSTSTRSRSSSSLKRKSSAHGDAGRQKKPRGEETYLWTCCECRTENNYKLAPICIKCNHPRCRAYCSVDVIEPNAQEEELSAHDSSA